MSAKSRESVAEAVTRLNAAIAEMGKQEAVRSIFLRVMGPGSEGMFTGVKAPEPTFTVTEQIDHMVARHLARTQGA